MSRSSSNPPQKSALIDTDEEEDFKLASFGDLRKLKPEYQRPEERQPPKHMPEPSAALDTKEKPEGAKAYQRPSLLCPDALDDIGSKKKMNSFFDNLDQNNRIKASAQLAFVNDEQGFVNPLGAQTDPVFEAGKSSKVGASESDQIQSGNNAVMKGAEEEKFDYEECYDFSYSLPSDMEPVKVPVMGAPLKDDPAKVDYPSGFKDHAQLNAQQDVQQEEEEGSSLFNPDFGQGKPKEEQPGLSKAQTEEQKQKKLIEELMARQEELSKIEIKPKVEDLPPFEKLGEVPIKGTSYSLFFDEALQADKLREPLLQLNHIEREKVKASDNPFRFGIIRNSDNFNLRFDHGKHKKEYDAVADFVIASCQQRLKTAYGLREVMVPDLATYRSHTSQLSKSRKIPVFPQAPVFMSEEFRKPSKANAGRTALVLIQGTGAVRAGIWARSATITSGFEEGSMLPQVEWAVKEKDYPVLIMNPNYNKDPATGKKVPLSGTMEAHATLVWEKFLEPSQFQRILVIAHSAGGLCLKAIQTKFAGTFYKQVAKIALTDSSVVAQDKLSVAQKKFMLANCVHYVASHEKLGADVSPFLLGKSPGVKTCAHVSAGHPKHEYTTGCSWPMIMWQFSD